MLKGLAAGADVLESGQVGLAVGPPVGTVAPEMVRDLGCASTVNDLFLEGVGDGLEALDLLLEVRDEVLHALAAQADHVLLLLLSHLCSSLCLCLSCDSCAFILLMVMTQMVRSTCIESDRGGIGRLWVDSDLGLLVFSSIDGASGL